MHCSMDQMDHFCVALQHDARTKKKSKLLLWTLSPTASPTFGAMSCSTDACSVCPAAQSSCCDDGIAEDGACQFCAKRHGCVTIGPFIPSPTTAQAASPTTAPSTLPTLWSLKPGELQGAASYFSLTATGALDLFVASSGHSNRFSLRFGQMNSCNNGRRDGLETDLDCGGRFCQGCAIGR